jgi:hypothetical protein
MGQAFLYILGASCDGSDVGFGLMKNLADDSNLSSLLDSIRVCVLMSLRGEILFISLAVK